MIISQERIRDFRKKKKRGGGRGGGDSSTILTKKRSISALSHKIFPPLCGDAVFGKGRGGGGPGNY